jgi:glutathione S-transferase
MNFPNLPYLIDGDLKISETLAIVRYIANKYDKSLLGTTVEDQAIVDQLLCIIHGMKS